MPKFARTYDSEVAMRAVRLWVRRIEWLSHGLAQSPTGAEADLAATASELTQVKELLAIRMQFAISTMRALVTARLNRLRAGTSNKLAYYGTEADALPAETTRHLQEHPPFLGWTEMEGQISMLEHSGTPVEERAVALIALWQARPRKRDRLPKVNPRFIPHPRASALPANT